MIEIDINILESQSTSENRYKYRFFFFFFFYLWGSCHVPFSKVLWRVQDDTHVDLSICPLDASPFSYRPLNR